MSTTTFEVYTYFGRIISRHTCDHTKETHHRAAEEARLAAARHHNPAWIRIV